MSLTEREFEWIDGEYRMKIITHLYSGGTVTFDICRWDDEKKEWDYRDERDDWTGVMLLEGFGMLIDFLKLGKEVE